MPKRPLQTRQCPRRGPADTSRCSTETTQAFMKVLKTPWADLVAVGSKPFECTIQAGGFNRITDGCPLIIVQQGSGVVAAVAIVKGCPVRRFSNIRKLRTWIPSCYRSNLDQYLRSHDEVDLIHFAATYDLRDRQFTLSQFLQETGLQKKHPRQPHQGLVSLLGQEPDWKDRLRSVLIDAPIKLHTVTE